MRDKWPLSQEKVGELPRDTCVGRLILSTRRVKPTQLSAQLSRCPSFSCQLLPAHPSIDPTYKYYDETGIHPL